MAAGFTLFTAGCGDDDDDSGATPTEALATTVAAETTTPEVTEAPAETTDAGATETTGAEEEPASTEAGGSEAEAEAALADLYAAAQEEGSVTIYSSQGLDQLNATADAFETKYPGVDVEVVRGTDADAIPRIETELATNTSGGDLIVTASPSFMIAHGEAGDWVDPTASPQIAGVGSYDADLYVHDGNFFEVGAAVLTFAWNTNDVPDGLTDYADLLTPELAGGRIAVIDPAISPAAVDYYLWLEETFGEEYVEQLAAQEPRIYPSALPIGEALTSGEVSAAAYAAPGTLIPASAAGAPVDFGISESGAWAARFFGAIPKSSDSPNAAALLADFIVTPEGQELLQSGAGSVQPDVPGTLITNDEVRVMDLEATAPEPAAAYVEKWNALFR